MFQGFHFPSFSRTPNTSLSLSLSQRTMRHNKHNTKTSGFLDVAAWGLVFVFMFLSGFRSGFWVVFLFRYEFRHLCLCFGVILGWVSGFVCISGLCFGRGFRPLSVFHAGCSRSVGFNLSCSYFCSFFGFSDLVFCSFLLIFPIYLFFCFF